MSYSIIISYSLVDPTARVLLFVFLCIEDIIKTMHIDKEHLVKLIIIPVLITVILVLGIVTCSMCRYAAAPLPISEEYAIVAERKMLSQYDEINSVVSTEAYNAKEQGRTKYEEDYIKAHTPQAPFIISAQEKRLVPPSPYITSSNYIIRYTIPQAPNINSAEIYSIEKAVMPPTITSANYYTLHKPDAPLFVSVEQKTTTQIPSSPDVPKGSYILYYSVPEPAHIIDAKIIHPIPEPAQITGAKVIRYQAPEQNLTSQKAKTKLLCYTIWIRRGNYDMVTIRDHKSGREYKGKLNSDLMLFTSYDDKIEFIL